MDPLHDAVGTSHDPVDPARARIVSLVPSLTELVCDLGLQAALVGRTGFCIHPWETVRSIPKIGGTKDVKIDRIRELAPTHVILNVDENTRETAQALAAFVPHLIVTHPLAPEDNPPLYRLIGEIFDRREAAEALCAAFDGARAQLDGGIDRPVERVLYLIWRDPWMTVGPDTYIARTLALRGWLTVPRRPEGRYPTIELPAFAGRVDRVLLSSEPFHFKAEHVDEVAGLLPDARVSLIDGEMTSWYGSRAIAGLRYLAEYASAEAVS